MEFLLFFFTILGGLAALAYFWEKIFNFFSNNPTITTKPLSLKSPITLKWADLRVVKELNEQGIASSSKVFSNDSLKEKEFSSLLLAGKMRVEKTNGHYNLHIDISKSKKAIYTTIAKKVLCNAIYDYSEMIEFAKKVDSQIHTFFLSKNRNETPIEIDLESMPLRWASGGIFPVIKYDNERWTPFFFRDIEPAGWNIPLGASESFLELKNPWSMMWREFAEEFLILLKTSKNTTFSCRLPQLTDDIQINISTHEAHKFAEEHLKLRSEFDNLDFTIDEEHIVFSKKKSNVTMNIKSESGTTQCKNILIAVNPLELGIELVGIVNCSIESFSLLLDGEILKPIGKRHELVRMPVALISHKYLSRNFSRNTDLKLKGRIQGSVHGDAFRGSVKSFMKK